MSPGKPVRRWRAYALTILAVLGSLGLALCAQAPSATTSKPQRHEYRHEIDQLEETWRDAVLKTDTAAMDTLLADDYIAILPDGTLQTKEQTLANLRSGTTHFTDIKVADRRVRFYGTTALVTSRTDVTGTSATGAISGSFRYTRVYVRDKQGKWKIVSFEASRILRTGKRK
jgi:ketosteroid isomerase-like protein